MQIYAVQIYLFESIVISYFYADKKLQESKGFHHISLLWSTNKAQRVFFQKTIWSKPKIITKLTLYLKG